jgi:hypothetical protein
MQVTLILFVLVLVLVLALCVLGTIEAQERLRRERRTPPRHFGV